MVWTNCEVSAKVYLKARLRRQALIRGTDERRLVGIVVAGKCDENEGIQRRGYSESKGASILICLSHQARTPQASRCFSSTLSRSPVSSFILSPLSHSTLRTTMLYNKALVPMVSRAMSRTTLTRSIGLLRPSFAVGMVRTYYRAFEDQATVLPNNIDTHKPEFKVNRDIPSLFGLCCLTIKPPYRQIDPIGLYSVVATLPVSERRRL